MTDHKINIVDVIIALMNLRSSVASGHTSITDAKEKQGADTALTMAVEDFKALMEKDTDQ